MTFVLKSGQIEVQTSKEENPIDPNVKTLANFQFSIKWIFTDSNKIIISKISVDFNFMFTSFA